METVASRVKFWTNVGLGCPNSVFFSELVAVSKHIFFVLNLFFFNKNQNQLILKIMPHFFVSLKKKACFALTNWESEI